MSSKYIVIGCKPWNLRVFNKVISKLPGEWQYLENKADVTIENIATLNPQYLFFLHWSEKVPQEIINRFQCVCFHMTDVPFGRGGSPLQNLIVRGIKETKLTALRMSNQFDAGPVYLKKPMSLYGSAEEIFIRSSYISAEMIAEIIATEPVPKQQEGEPVIFKRRTPSESQIANINSLGKLHDFIRMLDADGYPKAFLEFEGFKFEFKRSVLYHGRIHADVIITKMKERISNDKGSDYCCAS